MACPFQYHLVYDILPVHRERQAAQDVIKFKTVLPYERREKCPKLKRRHRFIKHK